MIRVLVADDHPAFGEAVRELLRAEPDIEVVAVVLDGDAAVALAIELRPDVVVADIVMPGTSGIDATLQILAQRPEISVLALSLHTDARLVAAMMAAGAQGFVVKDHAGEDLVPAVRALAAGAVWPATWDS